jgi:micrococcal nuclease
MYKYYITVLRVIDGDTIDAMVDLGFDTWVKKRIRFMGIDAPETRTRDLEEKARGVVCKERVREILRDNEMKAELISHGVGKFGRVLGVIRVKSSKDSLNDLLVAEGLAETYPE